MSLAKGINAHVAAGTEVNVGTKGVIDTFSRILSESMRVEKDAFNSEYLGGDWDADVFYSASRVVGSLVFEQNYTGNELFWKNLLLNYTYTANAPVAGVNNHVFNHSPSANTDTSISVEVPRGIGGAKEQTYLGCHVEKVTFEFGPKKVATSTFDLLGMSASRAAATAATFPTAAPVLPAHKTSLTIGGANVTVLSGSLEIALPRDGGREHYGALRHKEAVVIGRPAATFNLECEFGDATDADIDTLMQAFENETTLTTFALAHSGNIIVGATKESLTFTGTSVKILEVAPSVQDNGIVKATVKGQIVGGLTITFINATSQIT